MAGFTSKSLLQTDLLFFNNKMPPFDKSAVRQAFAYATDKVTLANAILKGAAFPLQTIIPPGRPGYQPNYQRLQYDGDKTSADQKSVYEEVVTLAPLTC